MKYSPLYLFLMYIPEKLQKCGQKELQQILAQKKYFVSPGDAVCEYLGRVKNVVVLQRCEDNRQIAIASKQFHADWSVLTPAQISPIQDKIEKYWDEFKESSLEEFMRKLKGIACRYYPAKDVEVVNTNENTVRLGIRFPELTVTNACDITHVVRGIIFYTTFSRRSGVWKGYEVLAHKTIFTAAELHNGYFHSHISMPSKGEPSTGICLGNYNGLMTPLWEALNKSKFKELPSYLMALYAYLSWESLDGGPYRKIDALYTFTPYEVSNPSFEFIRMEMLEVLEKADYLDYIYDISEGETQIDISTDAVVQYLESINHPKYRIFNNQLCEEIEPKYNYKNYFGDIKPLAFNDELIEYTVIDDITHRMEEAPLLEDLPFGYDLQMIIMNKQKIERELYEYFSAKVS